MKTIKIEVTGHEHAMILSALVSYYIDAIRVTRKRSASVELRSLAMSAARRYDRLIGKICRQYSPTRPVGKVKCAACHRFYKIRPNGKPRAHGGGKGCRFDVEAAK